MRRFYLFKKTTLVPLLCAASISVTSCKTSSSDSLSQIKSTDPAVASNGKLGIGLNDVSILFPYFKLDGSENQFKAMADKMPVLGEAHLPAKFREQLRAKQAGSNLDLNGKHMLVGMRLVPCANALSIAGKVEACRAMLQTTWQLAAQQETGDPQEVKHILEDSSFHVIYNLTKDEVKDIVKTLKGMHKAAPVDTEDMPLQVSPAILREGLDGQYFKSALGIANRYANASRLFGFSSFFVGGKRNVWQFAQAAIVNDKFFLVPVPTTEGPAPIQTITGGLFRAPSPVELSNSKKALPSLGDVELFPFNEQFYDTDVATGRKFVENAHISSNPSLQDIQSIDCASCHLAPIATKVSAKLSEIGGLDKFAFRSSKWNLENLTSPGTNIFRFQMFSYDNTLMKVSQRVINESAETLHFLQTKGYLD